MITMLTLHKCDHCGAQEQRKDDGWGWIEIRETVPKNVPIHLSMDFCSRACFDRYFLKLMQEHPALGSSKV